MICCCWMTVSSYEAYSLTLDQFSGLPSLFLLSVFQSLSVLLPPFISSSPSICALPNVLNLSCHFLLLYFTLFFLYHPSVMVQRQTAPPFSCDEDNSLTPHSFFFSSPILISVILPSFSLFILSLLYSFLYYLMFFIQNPQVFHN